jgi:hypothetical protein
MGNIKWIKKFGELLGKQQFIILRQRWMLIQKPIFEKQIVRAGTGHNHQGRLQFLILCVLLPGNTQIWKSYPKQII